MKDFISKLISGSSPDVSSRRVVALVTLIFLFIVISGSLIIGSPLPEFIFWGLVTIVLTCLGLTVVKP